MHIRHIALIAIICLLSIGCARSVTDKQERLRLEIELDFNGPVNLEKYNYYVIFSKSSSVTITLPDIFSSIEDPFPTPGKGNLSLLEDNDLFNSRGITFYYINYFSTWSDYLVANTFSTDFISSGSTFFNKTTSDNAIYQPTVGFEATTAILNQRTLQLSLDVEYLSANLRGTRYISFATSKRIDENETGIFMDKTIDKIQITLAPNETVSGQDISNHPVDPGADIIGWRAKIF